MVMIPQVNDSTDPQGHIEITRRAQAKAEDFGGGVAQAQGRFAGDVGDAASAIQTQMDVQDVTDKHVKLAQASVAGLQFAQQTASQMQPGDQSLVPQVNDYMDKSIQAIADSATTAKGRALALTGGAQVAAEITRHAIGQQAMLNGQAATNAHEQLINCGTQTVGNDPTQLDSSLARTNAAIDDPNGMYARIPQTERDKFRQDALERLSFAAAHGTIRSNPGAAIATLGPNIEQHAPGEALVQASAATGATPDLSPATLALAPQVIPAAAQTGVIPNVLLGQIEVGGTEPQKVQDQAVSMAALLKVYGGDYYAALGAYHIGTNAVDAAMQQLDMDWQSHIPGEAQTYINAVMQKGGMVPGAAPPPGNDGSTPPTPAPPGAPTQSSIPGWNNLNFQQQTSLAHEAVELQNQQLAEGRRQREDARQAQQDQRDTLMTQALRQMDDPKTNGAFNLKGYQNNPTLDWRDIHALDDIYRQKRTQDNSDENRANPFVFHDLMVQIHAADSDPSKTYSDENAFAAFRAGRISWGQFSTLRNEVTQLKDGNTTGFQQQLFAAKRDIGSSYAKDLTLSMIPGASANAAYRFNFDLDNKVAEYRATGKNPRTLLDPNAPDFALKPENIAAFAAGAKPALADQAAKAIAAGKVDRTIAPGYTVGKAYTDAKGRSLVYQGGPVLLSTSWGATAPAQKQATPPPQPEVELPTQWP